MKGEHIMGKVISFRRKELVWEEYGRDWTEEDFEELKGWLSKSDEGSDNAIRYSVIKDVSFNELCDIFSGKIPEVAWEIKCQVGENSWIYKEGLVDYIQEIMREEAWDRGTRECWSADDSEEDVNIYE